MDTRSTTAFVDDDEDDDPVVASFDVLLKPPLPADQSLYVLQYPNRATDNPAQLRNPEIERLRIKPNTGMVEIDVPLGYDTHYDKKKGITWGTALRKTMDSKGGMGSLGLAGGFGINSAPVRRPGRPGAPTAAAAAAAAGEGSDHLAWAEAVRTNNVLDTQSLSGLGANDSTARYMVAVFQGGNLHLTPVANFIHLRPVLHHLDAAAEIERASRPAPPVPTAGAKEAGAKAIHMTIKSAMGEDEVIETMKDRLKAIQQERWERFEYVHEESDAAWEAYNEGLLMELKKSDDTVMRDGGAREDKGKQIATSTGASAADEGVARLEADWDEDQLLHAVAGHDDMDDDQLVTAAEGLDIKGRGKVKEEAVEPKTDPDAGEPKRRPGRPPKGAAAASTSKKPPARGKGSSRTSAMEID